jgi:hypothetical protein
MAGFVISDVADAARAIGRASVFYTSGSAWNGATDLQDKLVYLGDTEGEIQISYNDEYSDLTVPELTGPAIHKRYYQGVNPTISIPLWLASPTLRAVVSPIGSGSGGLDRRQAVTEHSLAIFPEETFLTASNAYQTLDYSTAGGWTIGGTGIGATTSGYIAQSIWIWRGHFEYPPYTFRNADGGKAVDTVTFQVMQTTLGTSLVPNGQRLWTLGDPATASVDISPSG